MTYNLHVRQLSTLTITEKARSLYRDSANSSTRTDYLSIFRMIRNIMPVTTNGYLLILLEKRLV